MSHTTRDKGCDQNKEKILLVFVA